MLSNPNCNAQNNEDDIIDIESGMEIEMEYCIYANFFWLYAQKS